MSPENQLSGRWLDDESTGDALQLLLKNISSLDKALELGAVLQESLEVIEQVMNVEASSLMLRDESTDELIISLPTGPVRKKIKGKRLGQGMGVGGWVLENGKSYFTNDPSNDKHFAGDLTDEFTTRNIICVPMKDNRGKVFGVLQAINREGNRNFSEQDEIVFEALADHVAIAIERTRELEEMRKELKNKELLLTEVHHRLKNNLSTITALIEMELSDIEDNKATQLLQKTCTRIDSMTEVHNLLYNSGFNNEVDLGHYLERLAGKISDILAKPSQKIDVEIRAESVQIDTERAMSCGLLLNELMVNCYKHAFENRSEGGRIRIKLTYSADHYVTLTVSDNGIGIADNFKLEDTDSVGGWLVNVLLRRLEAAIDITHNNGTTFIIRFKK